MSRLFFHGTSAPVHTFDEPFLDPARAKGKDEGDPTVPHVFLTPNLTMARMFALKEKLKICTIGTVWDTAVLVCKERPDLDVVGYVYQFNESDGPFEETIARGQPTGKYVSYKPLNVSQGPCETINGLRSLMQGGYVQAYCFAEGVDEHEFAKASRDVRFSGNWLEWIQQGADDGVLHHINEEIATRPQRFAARRKSVIPQRQR